MNTIRRNKIEPKKVNVYVIRTEGEYVYIKATDYQCDDTSLDFYNESTRIATFRIWETVSIEGSLRVDTTSF